MKAIRLRKPGGLDALYTASIEAVKPAADEIVVRLHASSLNYHDYAIVTGSIPTVDGRIPMSDGAGEVVEVGMDVTQFAPGDAVTSLFWPGWVGGNPLPSNLAQLPGDRSDGYAREYVTASASAFTRAPRGYSYMEASTLTCAGLTAWRCLVFDGGLKQGDTVLVQGSGGVSVFALQFAKMAGCQVIATSSSDDKLERLKALGADHLINYRSTPNWGAHILELTEGRGADQIIEIGGAGTLPQSIQACRLGGHIALIGVLAGVSGKIPTAALMAKQIRLHGVMVGSREHQLDMIRAIDITGMKPVIDRSFALEQMADAFRYQESGEHLGKICLEY